MSPVASAAPNAAVERVIAWIIGGQSPVPSLIGDSPPLSLFLSPLGTVPNPDPLGDCPQSRIHLGTVPKITGASHSPSRASRPDAAQATPKGTVGRHALWCARDCCRATTRRVPPGRPEGIALHIAADAQEVAISIHEDVVVSPLVEVTETSRTSPQVGTPNVRTGQPVACTPKGPLTLTAKERDASGWASGSRPEVGRARSRRPSRADETNSS